MPSFKRRSQIEKDRESWFDAESADKVDSLVRKRLANWAEWQRSIPEPSSRDYPNPQPMFREMKSGWNEEDADSRKNSIAPDVDDAEKVEAIICMLSKHNQSVLWRYFVKERSTVKCGANAGMSQRKFEIWLQQAIGQVTQVMMLYAHKKNGNGGCR